MTHPRNHQLFESELLNPMRGHELSPLEEFVGSLLLDASSEKPIYNAMIRQMVQASSLHQEISERTVKEIIRTLRKDHAFPIISRRKPPSGYWWCSSKREMEEFIEVFKSQALDELHTLSRIVKSNFPELAGQLRLEEIETR